MNKWKVLTALVFSLMLLNLPYVSVASNITFVSKTSGDGSPNYLNGACSIFVVGDYAYIVSPSDDALTIFNISDPSNPTHVGAVVSSDYLNHSRCIFVSGDYAYIVGGGYHEGILSIYNISDPTNPTYSGSIAGYGSPTYLGDASSVVISGNYAYIIGRDLGDDALTIFNISDPSNPTHVGEIHGAGSPNYLFTPRDVYIVGSYAYITAMDDDALTIFDISDPSNPTHVGKILHDPEGPSRNLDAPQDVVVEGNYAYVACRTGSGNAGAFNIIDISTPSNPLLVGELHIVGSGQPYVSEATCLFVKGAYTFILTMNTHTISAFDISDPSNPSQEAYYYSNDNVGNYSYPNALFILGNYVYAVDDNLTIYDISTLYNTAPTLTWTGETNYESDGVHPDSDFTLRPFTFRVKYTDADNDPPSSMQTWLDESKNDVYAATEKHDMTEVDASDTDYTDGKLYEYTRTISGTSGLLDYKFMGNDGTDTAYSSEKQVDVMKGVGPGPPQPTTAKPPEPTTTPPKTSPSIIPPDVKTDLMIVVVIFMMITLGVVAWRKK